MPVVFYDSLGEFEASLPEHVTRTMGYLKADKYAQARKDIWRGDPGAVKRSEALLDQLEQGGMESPTQQWENDRVGMLPCVPSYLAGDPDSMRRLTDIETDTAPVKIFVDVCVSASLTSQQLEQRGAAILALVRKLAMIRPVELWAFAGLDEKRRYNAATMPVIRLDTAPMDLTTVSYVLGNSGFLRQICFAWGYDGREFSGGFAFNGSPTETRDQVARALGKNPQDVLINGGYGADPMILRPLEWVNEQVSLATANRAS